MSCELVTVARSYDVHANFANLSSQNFGEFSMRLFRNTCTYVLQQLHDSLEKTCEQARK